MVASFGYAVPAPARQDNRDFAAALLSEHNSERDWLGLHPLSWSDKLAYEAWQWAEQLAKEGRMRHSTSRQRGGTGENLWAGTIGYYRISDAVRDFIKEKQYFIPGVFPDIASTGRWQDVGHYTQIIWPETQQVGCGMARGRSYDFLVCRYWPAGNIIGQRLTPQNWALDVRRQTDPQ
ncbi:CAP domain-containing protein [Altericroceibacterium spongiae]|nr:CAP domain-containing protein [Altericroceibacterium spongiae]